MRITLSHRLRELVHLDDLLEGHDGEPAAGGRAFAYNVPSSLAEDLLDIVQRLDAHKVYTEAVDARMIRKAVESLRCAIEKGTREWSSGGTRRKAARRGQMTGRKLT